VSYPFSERVHTSKQVRTYPIQTKNPASDIFTELNFLQEAKGGEENKVAIPEDVEAHEGHVDEKAVGQSDIMEVADQSAQSTDLEMLVTEETQQGHDVFFLISLQRTKG
jgi:hypothetical protein